MRLKSIDCANESAQEEARRTDLILVMPFGGMKIGEEEIREMGEAAMVMRGYRMMGLTKVKDVAYIRGAR